MFRMVFINTKILIFFSIVLLLSCTDKSQKDVLAKIGDKEITADEFLNRAELTPRPHYCRSGSEKSKNIILNTLITEKLFALEERSESALLKEPNFQAFIKGRKEQYMREELFSNMAADESELDSTELIEMYHLAGRVYDVSYVKLHTNEATALKKEMEVYPGIETTLFNETISDKIPKHTVHFEDQDLPAVHYTLYDKKWNKGDIIGPFALDETEQIILKIENVTVKPVLSQTETLNRRKQVTESLVRKETNIRWNEFLASVMKGKEIHFIPEITIKAAELWRNNFTKDGKLKQYTGFSDKNYGGFLQDLDQISAETMFTLNDEIWTVADFKNALSSHPLVFRKRDIMPPEFMQQFRFAVADLIQDIFINQEAYKLKLDKSESIQRKVAMWEDAYLALEHRTDYLKKKRRTAGEKKKTKNYHALIEGYIENLLHKHKDQIAINMELFNSLELTHTDYITRQYFVPYNQVVPSFPLLTRNDQLIYGSTLN